MISGVIAGIGMAFAAIGTAAGATAIGGAMVSAIGAAWTGFVISAVVGAAIGGISAAVMGGDIGKGMLFGAIGGVVTVGVSGAISGAIGGASSITTTAGTEVMTVGGGEAAQLAAAEAAMIGGNAGGGVTGASMGTMFGGSIPIQSLAGPVMDFIQGGLGPEVEGTQEDFGKTKEGFMAALKSAEDKQRIANEGKAELPWASTEAGVTYQREQDYKQQQLAGSQKLEEVDKTYKMVNENAASEFDRQRGVFDDAATAVTGGEYQGATDETKAAIIAKEQSGSQQGMLQGAPPLTKPQVQEEVA